MKRTVLREIKAILISIITALMYSLAYHVFVYPNNFVPSGLDGITTILQFVTKVNAGIFNIAFNIPLLVLACIFLNKRFAIYTVVHVLCVSGFLMLWDAINFYQFVGTGERLLPAVAAGIICGVASGLLIKNGFSSGGFEVVGCLIQNKKPLFNVERIASILSYIVIVVSLFVYKDLSSALLAILTRFCVERTCWTLLRDNRQALKFEIVTNDIQQLRAEIVEKLQHSATVMDSHGIFSGKENKTIVVIVNLHQLSQFYDILRNYPDVFVYHTRVEGVYGNFRRE